VQSHHPYPRPTLTAAGLIGTAPSAELLAIWNERERKLNADGPDAVTLGGARPGPGWSSGVVLMLSFSVQGVHGCHGTWCA